MKKALVVDDDSLIVKLVSSSLPNDDFSVATASNGKDGLELATKKKWDVIVLDITMPLMDGFEVCERIRADHIETPILFLTSENSDDSVVKGLHIGADDYITKPFSPSILKARIETLVRRPQISQQETITIGNLTINTTKKLVRLDDEDVKLRNKEFELLLYLAQRQEQFISKRTLLREIWDVTPENSSNRLEACVKNLKKAFREHSSTSLVAIENVRNMGYRIV